MSNTDITDGDNHTSEYKSCHGKMCVSSLVANFVWTQWFPWSSCFGFCGTGIQKRIRQCKNGSEVTPSIHAENNCSGKKDYGKSIKFRTIFERPSLFIRIYRL